MILVVVGLGVNALNRNWKLCVESNSLWYGQKTTDLTRLVFPSDVLMTMTLVGSVEYRYLTVGACGCSFLTRILLVTCRTCPSFPNVMYVVMLGLCPFHSVLGILPVLRCRVWL